MSGRDYAIRHERGVPNGAVSFWYQQIGIPAPGPALPGDAQADVCIVGGGLTGLWTAYHLAEAQPDLRIVTCVCGRFGHRTFFPLLFSLLVVVFGFPVQASSGVFHISPRR